MRRPSPLRCVEIRIIAAISIANSANWCGNSRKFRMRPDRRPLMAPRISEQLAWVGEASPKWGPVLGPAVRHMLGIEEERKREGQTELKPARTSRRGNPPPIKKLLALERSRTNLLLSPVKRVRRRRTAPNSTGRQQGLVERTVDHHQGRD